MDVAGVNLLTTFLIVVVAIVAFVAIRWDIKSLINKSSVSSTLPVNFLSQNEFIEHLLDIDFTKHYALIDVRDPSEYQKGHIQHAINIPHKQIMANPALLTPYFDRQVIVYCLSGIRSGEVCRTTTVAAGNILWQLEGGIQQWKQHKRPLIRSK